jgi:Zn-dependent peptidase ImmA (M78 family)
MTAKMDDIRRLCRAVMADSPETVELRECCTRLAVSRGREVLLLPFTGDGQSPSGVWVKGRYRDYIFYDSVASPVHQEAIIGHELAHMLLDHPGPVMDPAAARLLLPDLDPLVVMRMLRRDTYSHWMEREAEELAGLLMLDRAEHRQRLQRVAQHDSLRRLRQAMGCPDDGS